MTAPLEDCSICLSNHGMLYAVRHKNRVEGVNHRFHEVCLLNWTKIKPTCPLCQRKITHINGKSVLPQQEEVPVPRIYGEENINFLFFAIQWGTTQDVILLLQAASYIRTEDLSKALKVAAKYGNIEAIEALCSCEDFEELVDAEMLFQAVVIALCYRQTAAALFLLDREGGDYSHGAELVTKSMIWGARANLLPFMRELLAKKMHSHADLLTAIQEAEAKGHEGMVQLLLSAKPCFWRSFERLASCTIQ